jgi:hypothetical protein
MLALNGHIMAVELPRRGHSINRLIRFHNRVREPMNSSLFAAVVLEFSIVPGSPRAVEPARRAPRQRVVDVRSLR